MCNEIKYSSILLLGSGYHSLGEAVPSQTTWHGPSHGPPPGPLLQFPALYPDPGQLGLGLGLGLASQSLGLGWLVLGLHFLFGTQTVLPGAPGRGCFGCAAQCFGLLRGKGGERGGVGLRAEREGLGDSLPQQPGYQSPMIPLMEKTQFCTPITCIPGYGRK